MNKVLVVIDMQNDFIDGVLGTEQAREILPYMEARIKNSKDELILFTQDTHYSDYLSTPEGKKLPVPHCIEGTEGWLIHESLLNAWEKNGGTIKDNSIPSHTFIKNVFGSTELVDYLNKHQAIISEIELVGVCTDICVISNAIMIKNTLPHIPLVIDASLCAGVSPESHTRALEAMKVCQIDVI